MGLFSANFWLAEDKNTSFVDVLVLTASGKWHMPSRTGTRPPSRLWEAVGLCFLCLWVPWMYLHRLGSQLWEWISIWAAVAVWHYQVSNHCNGGKERINHTLGNMLRALPLRAKQDWPQQIQTLTWIPLAMQLSTGCFTVFQGFLLTLCSNLSDTIPLWQTPATTLPVIPFWGYRNCPAAGWWDYTYVIGYFGHFIFFLWL